MEAVFLDAFFSRAFLVHLASSLIPAFGPFLLAGTATIVLTPGAMWLARRLGFVAAPGGRHIHLQPTPMLGGWALYLAFAGSQDARMTSAALESVTARADAVRGLIALGAVESSIGPRWTGIVDTKPWHTSE